uniref:Cadherin domain-containing protein n=1 Tax=Syphacia muris TaxID=451379 RepID=A0A0N5ATP2_9BILA
IDSRVDDLINIITDQTNRSKRESSIEYRSCNHNHSFFLPTGIFSEVFIPLAIAMIPVGLLALLLCVFCCGPKESRGKKLHLLRRKIAERTPESGEIDGIELVCKDGIVMRNDSKKTRFSTAIYFIESRRVSIDIIDDTGLPVSMQPNAKDTINENEFRSIQDTGIIQQQTSTDQKLNNG